MSDEARVDAKQAQEFVGRTLGGAYRVVRLAASGGFAWVFEARHEVLDMPVAVKILKPIRDAALADYVVAHFEAEARLGFQLRHPGIARVFDFRQEAKAEYIIMEWLDGKNLAHLADCRPVAWRRATELVLQACEALQIIHTAGYIHRDIKPDNLVVLQEGKHERVVLIDLGLARHLPLQEPLVASLEDVTVQPCLTPGFCAPEIFRAASKDETPFSVLSDIFAMGVTLYQLLAGRRPWHDQAAITVGEVPPPPTEWGTRLPDALVSVVMRAIAIDPRARQPSAEVLAGDLRAVLSREARAVETPTRVDPPLAAALPPPPPRRSRTRIRAVAAAAVGLGLCLPFLMRSSTTPPASTPSPPASNGSTDTPTPASTPPPSSASTPTPAPTPTPRPSPPEAVTLASSSSRPATPKPRSPSQVRSFESVMRSLEGPARRCATGAAPIEVKVTAGEDVVAVRVLDFPASHPTALCLERLVQAAAPPLEGAALRRHTFFAREM